jgi:ABC-type transport system substrate-binding protein
MAPQYGGTLMDYSSVDFTCWDPYYQSSSEKIYWAYYEGLFGDNWAMDPSLFNYSADWRPPTDVTGLLAQDWEFTSAKALTVHLRQNVYWQNISPVNGRQMTSADVVYNYCRLFGLGDGFTSPGPYMFNQPLTPILTGITAPDKFTVVLTFNTTNVENILESTEALDACPIVPSEVVTAYGDTNDWHHAIGTGPFILSDFVGDTSVTMIKNPNYWGYDERFPQNQLPYVNGAQILVIPNEATALSALRVGKIDVMENIGLPAAQSLQKSNPDILQLQLPGTTALTIDPRNDLTPYNNINVRIALQEAINLPQIASSYYAGTCSPDPQTLTSYLLTGWGFPYDQWPSSLKTQYAYNPTNAKALLAAAGYPNGFTTDCVVDASADAQLLQIVQSEFASIGVNMTINSMPSASWTGYVFVSHKQDALAYRSSGTLGFSFQPMVQLLLYAPGDWLNYMMVNNAQFNALYPQALTATTTDQVKALLTQACQIVTQQNFVISLLNPSNFDASQPWLNGYNGQSFAMTGGTNGPLMFGYYASRFWIAKY